MPSLTVSSSMAHRPPLGIAVNTAALSVSSDAGNPQVAAPWWKAATTSAALNTLRASEAHQQPGVVIDHVEDLDVGLIGELSVGEVGLPSLVGHHRLEPHERALRALLRLGGQRSPGETGSASSWPGPGIGRGVCSVERRWCGP